MSVCANLMNGFDLECFGAEFRKYYQQVVLVNRNDIDEFYISSSMERNRIYFNLKEGKTGYLFRSTENGSVIGAEFSKTVRKGVVLYDHKVRLPIVGVAEPSKVVLKQLDMSDYFAAVQFKDNSIEIFGFSYGLRTDGYTYTPQGYGGAEIPLVSRFPEYDPPYIYVPSLNPDATGWEAQAVEDFDNLFADIAPIYNGDFNNDFNDDFFIEGA